MHQGWSHVGVRLTPELRRKLENLAETEPASISDLVRRALQIYLSGGPDKWSARQMELVRRSLPESAPLTTELPAEVQVCGEWLHGLPEPVRRFVFQVGHVLGSWPEEQAASDRWREFLRLSPVQMCCFELRPPLAADRPEQEQIETLLEQGVIVEVNDACAGANGYADPTVLQGEPLSRLVDTCDPGLHESLRTFIRGGYRLDNHLTELAVADGRTNRVLMHLVGYVEDGLLLRCWAFVHDVAPLGAGAGND